ncbi:hypothetical protein SLEP1_g59085 [Rubroshorea leprosula]|uniref:Uncharacterized protein n=1 Tax=Rubroshorea leprosula TaxID=152421 RepID=A0AAV5MVF2_9ROSI|nr:hypothetical protein SLEP1_g59085 [Rubroshorea leprosula]
MGDRFCPRPHSPPKYLNIHFHFDFEQQQQQWHSSNCGGVVVEQWHNSGGATAQQWRSNSRGAATVSDGFGLAAMVQ